MGLGSDILTVHTKRTPSMAPRVVRSLLMHTADDSSDPKPALAGPALGQGLEPLLRHACNDALGPVTWFRTDWQYGGAATGRASLKELDGTEHKVVVKLPVSVREAVWLERLQAAPQPLPVPRLFKSGRSLGEYDLAWIVIEWFPSGPLGMHWHESHLERTCGAAAAFHAEALKHPVTKDLPLEDWDDLFDRARAAVRTQSIDTPLRWKTAHKKLRKQMPGLVKAWRAREPIEWLHGDLHLANAMSRGNSEEGPVALIDLAEVRPGHWIEDAVYLERLQWARPTRLSGNSPVRHLAMARKAIGLENGPEYARLADIRRTLYAATAPAFLRTEGGAQLAASLDHLEEGLSRL